MELSDLEEVTNRLDSQKLKMAQDLIAKGVDIDDWRTLEVHGELICEVGVRIKSHVVIEGRVILKEGTTVGRHCYLEPSQIGIGSNY